MMNASAPPPPIILRYFSSFIPFSLKLVKIISFKYNISEEAAAVHPTPMFLILTGKNSTMWFQKMLQKNINRALSIPKTII